MLLSKVDMAEIHNPPETYGDCMRACCASILGLDRSDQLPHWMREKEELGLSTDQVIERQRRYLRQHFNLDVLCITGESDPRYLPASICIATGESPRFPGVWHDVVWQMDQEGGQMLHDPHPSRAGLIGKPKQFDFYVPLFLKAA